MKRILILAIALLPLSSIASSSCEEYYTLSEAYLEKASENTQIKDQVDAIKAQYEQTKKQLQSLSEEKRNVACKQGLDAMKMVEEQMKKMK